MRENRHSKYIQFRLHFRFPFILFNTDFGLSRGSFSRFSFPDSNFWNYDRTILLSMESFSKANLIFRCASAAFVIQFKLVEEQYSKFVYFWKNS